MGQIDFCTLGMFIIGGLLPFRTLGVLTLPQTISSSHPLDKPSTISWEERAHGRLLVHDSSPLRQNRSL